MMSQLMKRVYNTEITAAAASRDSEGNHLYSINPFLVKHAGGAESFHSYFGYQLVRNESYGKLAIEESAGSSSAVVQQNVGMQMFGDPRILLELPAVVIRKFLSYIDGETLLNLGKTSNKVHDAIYSAITGRLELNFWRRESEEWYKDDKLVKILSSMKDESYISWKDVHKNGKDVARILSTYNDVGVRLKTFGNCAKNDMAALYSVEDLSNRKFIRLSGCFGSRSYHILWPIAGNVVELCCLYREMVECNRVFKLGESPGQVITTLKMMIPIKAATFGNSAFVKYGSWIQNYLIVINQNSWTIVILDRESSRSFVLPEYDFCRASKSFSMVMPPMAAVKKNAVAIWSRPYNLQIFKVQSIPEDNLANIVMLHHLTETTSFQGEDKDAPLYLGTVWYKLCENNIKPLFTFGNATIVDQEIFVLKIAHPKFKLVSLKLVKNDVIRQREVNLDNHYDSKAAEELKESSQPLRHSYKEPVAVFWNYLGFTVSVNLIDWHWKTWKGILSGKLAYRGPSCVEVIDSEVIAIAAEGLIYLARIFIEGKERVDVKVFRVLTYASEHPEKIVKMTLDYDKGEPYLWIEVEKSGREYGRAFEFDFFKLKFSLEPQKYPEYDI